MKVFFALLICMSFLFSHFAETVDLCCEGEHQEDSHSIVSSQHGEDHSQDSAGKDCHTECHKCHHGIYLTGKPVSFQISYIRSIDYLMTTEDSRSFVPVFFRPPALS